MWVAAVHGVLAITVYFAVAMFYAGDKSVRNLREGKSVDPAIADPRFGPTVWVFFGLPAIACAWYLHHKGHDTSGIITGLIAAVLGWLKGRAVLGE